MVPGPKGTHNNHDSFDGQEPALPPAPPKPINAADTKTIGRKPGTAAGAPINKDTFCE